MILWDFLHLPLLYLRGSRSPSENIFIQALSNIKDQNCKTFFYQMAIPNPGCCSCMLKNSISIFRHFNIMTLSCHKSIAISYLRKSCYIKKGYLIEVSLIMIYRVFFYSVETKKAKSKINDEIKSGVG